MDYSFSPPKELVKSRYLMKQKKDPAAVVFSLHCELIPLLDEEIVAKIQSLESFYDVQIWFTGKKLSVLKFYHARLSISKELLFTTATVKELTFPAIEGNDDDILSRTASNFPVWWCTDLSKPGCVPFELDIRDSTELEKHFQNGGKSAILSGEEYFVDFKRLELKSNSGKNASLKRVPPLDGVPHQRVRVEINGTPSNVASARGALEKLLEESRVKASPIRWPRAPSLEFQEYISNIVRQYCVKYDTTYDGREFQLCITGTPCYVTAVRREVENQLVAGNLLKNEPAKPVSQFFSSLSSSLSTGACHIPKVTTISHPLLPVLSTSPRLPLSRTRDLLQLSSTKAPVLAPATATFTSSLFSHCNPSSSRIVPVPLGTLAKTNFNPVVPVTSKVNPSPVSPSRPSAVPSPPISPKLGPTFQESGKIPFLWAPQKEKCIFCCVERNTNEWNAVSKLAKKTMSSISLIKVERVQNIVLWEKYSLEGKHMHDRNNGSINERYLFHGTSKVDPHEVAKADSGVDFRYSKTNRKSLMWGTGAYFAEKLSYSDHYAFKSGGSRQVMIVSVLTGFSYAYGTTTCRELTKPPKYTLSEEPRLYDTVCGETGGSVVYVVYEHCKTCPAYIITYT